MFKKNAKDLPQEKSKVEDLQEQVKALRLQNSLLKSQEKEFEDKLKQQAEETKKWKSQAFTAIQDRDTQSDAYVLDSQPYRKLVADVSSLKTDKDTLEREIKALKQKMEEERAHWSMARAKLEEEAQRVAEQKAALRREHEQDLQETKEQLKRYEQQVEGLKSENEAHQQKIKELEYNLESINEILEERKQTIKSLHDQLHRKQVDSATNTRSVSEQEEIKSFQSRFSLPETEYRIGWYVCTFGKTQGTFNISPNYICWGANLLDRSLSFLTHSSDVVIPLSDIVSIEKQDKRMWPLPGKGSGVEIKLKNGKSYYFWAFVRRKEALKDVMIQVKKNGLSVTTLRDGKTEEWVK
ncbi:hypothetical protein QOT17_012643 [Balamuthia mandrillaris]